ncbi:MAG: phosphate signaling complex protein PhoU [Tissierellia bacterium]|nr:phosphate signaling complex protein PhoU [Tissierellia bacterium]
MRKNYDRELEVLNHNIIEMAAFVERAILNALTALETRDADLAKRVIKRDEEVDDMERDIEDMCLSLILRQQPVASDLRFISAALKIITDLERIGDHAQDISEISLAMPDSPLSSELDAVLKMYNESSYMIKTAVDAFITRDEDLANEAIAHDDVVDQLFVDFKDQIIEDLKGGSKDAEEYIDLLQISKYLERVGDHAENIAEWVIFSITGEHVDVDFEE